MERNKKLYSALFAALCFVVLGGGYTLAWAALAKPQHAWDNEEISYADETAHAEEDSLAQADDTFSAEDDAQGGDYASSLPGQYPFASERLLTESDLVGLSRAELKIMRNEIYARHGYIFQTPAMQEHFNAQPWYEGRYADVTSMLSDIEQANITFIKRHE